MSRSVRAALFDVDGTLVDTNYLHAVTWWEAFGQAGYRVVMADIHRAIGMGSDLTLDELLPGWPARAGLGESRAVRRKEFRLIRTGPCLHRLGSVHAGAGRDSISESTAPQRPARETESASVAGSRVLPA